MNSYLKIFNSIYYQQHDVKKFKKSVINRELKAAMSYGKVLVLQELLKQFAELEHMSKPEYIGDVQLKLRAAYKEVKDTLNLKLGELELDKIMPPEYVEQSASNLVHRFATFSGIGAPDNYIQDVSLDEVYTQVYPKHYDCDYNCTCLNFQGEHEESCPSRL